VKPRTRIASMLRSSGRAQNDSVRAAATPAFSSDAKGSGARPGRRLRATLVTFALATAALIVTAAPASAADLSAEVSSISNVSYASAQLNGKIGSPGGIFGTQYSFEYSTSESGPWTPGPGGSLSGELTKQSVTGTVEGLKGGTKYFVRLHVSTIFPAGSATSPEAPPYLSFTTLAVDPPIIVATNDASEVFSLSAKATGEVKRPANTDPAFDVTCKFEYVTDADFSATGFAGAASRPCQQNPIGAAGAGVAKTVSALIGCPNREIEAPEGKCLQPATTYHLRLSAENAAPGVVTKVAAGTFATQPAVAKPMVVGLDAASDLSEHAASLSGSVERPAGADPALDVSCRFEYITDAQFKENEEVLFQPGFEGAASKPCTQNPIASPGVGNPAVSAAVSARAGAGGFGTSDILIAGTTYHFRLSAENGGGSNAGAAGTFTTLPLNLPDLVVNPPSAGYTKATVSGTVNPNGCNDNGLVTGAFQYSTEPSNPNSWTNSNVEYSLQSACHETTPQPIGGTIVGLLPGTTYALRLTGTNYQDINVATPEPYFEFTTKGTNAPPTASLDPITIFTGTSAHFTGTVDTHAPAGALDDEGKATYKTEWQIECSPECKDSHGNVIGGTVGAEEGSKVISGDGFGLQPNTYYEGKLVAHNVLKTVESAQTFQTPLIPPSVKAEAGASDGEGGYILQGVVNSNNAKTSCTFEYGTTATYPNTYQAPCLPNPSGPDEVQNVNIDATEGQFKLGFRGQTTSDLPYNASTAEFQTALRALSQVGPTGVNVTGSPGAYVITFAGKLAGADVEPIKASDGTAPLGGGGGASVSTPTEGGIDHPVTVEAHVENLTIGSTYHFRIFTSNAAGPTSTADREFIPTLAPKGPACPNEALREENNSLALPECRAYEKVTPSGKQGFPAELIEETSDRVLFDTAAGDVAGSGVGSAIGVSEYVAERTATGWQTIPNFNGPGGSLLGPPINARKKLGAIAPPMYSADFRSSLWIFLREGEPADQEIWLRGPDGSIALVGKGCPRCIENQPDPFVGASDDLSHIVYAPDGTSTWGPGVYEFVGTGNDQPGRVDLDNSGSPISTCSKPPGGLVDPNPEAATAGGRNTVSSDGRVIFITVTGSTGAASCTGTGSPPADEVWARIGDTVSVDASASQCDRTAPAEPCNGPSNASFLGAASDGSRVFFSTKQQLLNGDTDETNDIYECDIPPGTPTPTGKANACTALREVSGAATGADVKNVYSISGDGSTVYFISLGVLSSNEDALGNTAQAGDRNFYAWRTDIAHPDGQTHFVGRLADSGLGIYNSEGPQATPDGRYLVFLTRTPLLPSDTDESLDLYRYDAESGLLTRVSTKLTGIGGNGDFDVQISAAKSSQLGGAYAHHVNTAISDDGQKVVFSTREPLSPVDGNNARDVYLWTPAGVSLITTGAVDGGETEVNPFSQSSGGTASISHSGRDIFINTAGALTASDTDQSGDVYDARVDGGFSFAHESCSGEVCQSPSPPPPTARNSGSGQPGPGNPPQPKPCPKGKVKKHGKCVKKPKQHSGKKHHSKKHKRANSNSGGGK
jgi:hypothetical protein